MDTKITSPIDPKGNPPDPWELAITMRRAGAGCMAIRDALGDDGCGSSSSAAQGASASGTARAT